MAKSKSKPKKREQQVIAEEAMVSQERRKLKQSISTLKRLPRDFRDIIAGTGDWEAFATITGRRQEMEDWDNGPIVHLALLNKHEEMILGSQNKLIYYACHLESNTWQSIINQANFVEKASWIYLPDEESKIITALNKLFSRFGYNVRAKGRLLSEHSGKPVGVVR